MGFALLAPQPRRWACDLWWPPKRRSCFGCERKGLTHCCRLLRFTLLAALTLLAVATPGKAEEVPLRQYINERYGFMLRFPQGLVGSSIRPDQSGVEFHTADGHFKVFAFAERCTGDPAQEVARRYQDELGLFGNAASSRQKGRHSSVISGVATNGTEFYSKIYANDYSVTLLRMTYPHAEHRTYDYWVRWIEKNFRPSRQSTPRP